MEKFGIFELLDALSAITAPDSPAPPPSARDDAPQETRQNDAAFRAPDYGGAVPAAQEAKPHADGALSSFLARHDEIAKKAERPK